MCPLLSHLRGGRGGVSHRRRKEERAPDPCLGREREPTVMKKKRSMRWIRGPQACHRWIPYCVMVDPPLGRELGSPPWWRGGAHAGSGLLGHGTAGSRRGRRGALATAVAKKMVHDHRDHALCCQESGGKAEGRECGGRARGRKN